MPNIVHILLRYHNIDGKRKTMKEHIDVLNDKGSVWWGILGVGMSIKRTEEIIDQLENGNDTKVLLTTLDNLGQRIFHMGNLIDILTDFDCSSPDEDDPEESELIPKYYNGEKHVSWLKFSDIKEVDDSVIKSFSLRSNPNGNLIKPLKGQASIMYIIEK